MIAFIIKWSCKIGMHWRSKRQVGVLFDMMYCPDCETKFPARDMVD